MRLKHDQSFMLNFLIFNNENGDKTSNKLYSQRNTIATRSCEKEWLVGRS